MLGVYRHVHARDGRRQFTMAPASKDKLIIMRHDVDKKPYNALRIAKIENELGIESTFYFRTTKEVFIPEIISEISNLGHEVGYHYEVLCKSEGNYDVAI